MTSLTEVYDGTAREMASPRRVYAGTALVLLGAVLAVVAVLVATTDLLGGVAATLTPEVASHYASVRLAGVLAGLGVPTALVGVFLVLPASRRVHAAAAISVSLCLLGVVLFWDAYPHDWRSYGDDLTLRVSAVYLLGLFTAVWSLFAALASFKKRNDPGGALEMNVTRHNRTVLEVSDANDSSGLGGIGFLGNTPDGNVETQTNVDGPGEGVSASNSPSPKPPRQPAAPSSPGTAGAPTGARTAATSDGGTAASDISSPLEGESGGAEIVDSPTAQADEPTDRYCGNCSHFEYVRSEGMVPYCVRHEAAMDDMDACEEWTPNRR